jgi:hypothetical protein
MGIAAEHPPITRVPPGCGICRPRGLVRRRSDGRSRGPSRLPVRQRCGQPIRAGSRTKRPRPPGSHGSRASERGRVIGGAAVRDRVSGRPPGRRRRPHELQGAPPGRLHPLTSSSPSRRFGLPSARGRARPRLDRARAVAALRNDEFDATRGTMRRGSRSRRRRLNRTSAPILATVREPGAGLEPAAVRLQGECSTS